MKNEKRKQVYDRKFKLKFMGYGEWIDEPDVVEFEYKGVKCLVKRVIMREPYAIEEAYFGGHLCGYIFLPEGHALYGKKTDEIDLECWCGITWTKGTEEGWMVGFDCAHSGDLVPTMEQMTRTIPELKAIRELREILPMPEEFKNCPLFNPTYKNVDFCIKQVKSLAKQAAKMAVA